MTMELWLVRHGETEFNTAQRFCGWGDPPLTHTGRAQARALRPLIGSQPFDRFVSSPSLRARETAQLCYGVPELDERLRELDFGKLEGCAREDCSQQVREALLDFDSFEAPGGESVAQLGERVITALQDLGPGRHLVVTHGGVIRFLVGLASVTDYPRPATLTRIRVDFEGTDSARVEIVRSSRLPTTVAISW